MNEIQPCMLGCELWKQDMATAEQEYTYSF